MDFPLLPEEASEFSGTPFKPEEIGAVLHEFEQDGTLSKDS